MAKLLADGVERKRQHRGWMEVVASFALAWTAIVIWYGLFPLLPWIETAIVTPGQWGELLGILVISGSYYLALSVVLWATRRLGWDVNAVITGYGGGWWLVVLLAILNIYSPLFHSVLGLSMATSGANLVFMSLFVGTAKYWIDGYLNPPPRPSDIDDSAGVTDDRSA